MRPTGDDGKRGLVSGVSEGDLDAGGKAEGVNVVLRDIEGDRHGKEGALSLAIDLGKSEGITDTVAISAKQSGEPARHRSLTTCSLPRS